MLQFTLPPLAQIAEERPQLVLKSHPFSQQRGQLGLILRRHSGRRRRAPPLRLGVPRGRGGGGRRVQVHSGRRRVVQRLREGRLTAEAMAKPAKIVLLTSSHWEFGSKACISRETPPCPLPRESCTRLLFKCSWKFELVSGRVQQDVNIEVPLMMFSNDTS